MALEKTENEKKLADRLKNNLQVRNAKSTSGLLNENCHDQIKENAIKKAQLLEKTRIKHLNKFVKNKKSEVEQYYKIYVE